MDKHQFNKLYGWNAVKHVLSEHKPVWEGLPAFRSGVDDLLSSWHEVDRNDEVQQQGTGWTTEGKNAFRDRAIHLALRGAGNLRVWAEDHDNAMVKAAAGISKSQLDVSSDPELSRVLGRIAGHSDDHLDELGDYGTDKEFLDAFRQAIKGFSEAIATPKSARSGCKTATGNIRAAIRSGDKALKRLDRLVANFSDSHPDFVATYRNARKAVHNGERHAKDKDDGKAAAD